MDALGCARLPCQDATKKAGDHSQTALYGKATRCTIGSVGPCARAQTGPRRATGKFIEAACPSNTHRHSTSLPVCLSGFLCGFLLSRNMGLVADVAGPLANFTSKSSTPVVVAAAFASFILLCVVLNVLKQLLFKKANEPPMVFHWLPIIGSTVTYGMDPYAFFFANHKKVCPT